MDEAVMELTPPNKSQIRSVLTNANYIRLLSVQIVGALGDRIHQMALLAFIIEISRSTNITKHVADITFWGALPTVALSPFALTLIDRWPWKRIMVSSMASRCVLAFAMPLLLATWYNIHTAWITAALLGTFAAVFGPCRLAIMPNLVPKNHLTTTNAVSSQVGTIATIFGVPFGGYLIDQIGRNAGFYVDGAAFFAATFLVSLLRPSRQKASEHHTAQKVEEDFMAGFRYLRGQPTVRLTILFFALLTMVSAVLYVCLFSYSIEVLGLNERGTGQLLGLLGLGMACGAVLLVWKPAIGDHPRLPYLGLAGAGLLIWRMSQGGSSHYIAALLFGVGFCGILSLIPNDTYLQRHVPDRVRGRVFVVRGFLVGLVWLFSLQFVKSAVHHMGMIWVLAWLGIGSVAMAILFGLLPSPRQNIAVESN